MHPPTLGFQSKFAALSLVLMLVVLWLAMRGYHGLTGDGQLYAFQAFARLHPPLTGDLYLQNTSQDQFTLFSPLYAWCIGLLGLENAARVLTLLFTVWFLAAAWTFARRVTHRDAAWLAVALLLIAAGDYGASGVFRIFDPYLTARLPAEAMILTALACHVSGRKRLALLVALAAIAIHPLMALPGVLVLVCLWLPARMGVVGAVGGILATLAIATGAIYLPAASRTLALMDPGWLHVVRERSEFLFLQLWSIRDWMTNAQPLIYLAFIAVAVTDERVRKLCSAAAIVGAAGLAAAFIAGLIGPVAILVQGQCWRWIWINVFVSVVLTPFTVLQVSRDEKCGPLCALLLVSGWTVPGAGGTACVTLAFMIWLARARINSRFAAHLRWVSVAFGVAVIAWSLTDLGIAKMQSASSLKFPAVMLGASVWWGIGASRKSGTRLLISAMLAALSILIFPSAFTQAHTLNAASDIHEFADWENAIPSTSTVLVAPPRDVGAFVWFTLGRPNYLSLNQSAGVVFSRATALEVKRRSEVLLPLMDPNWNILSSLQTKSEPGGRKSAPTRPLTHENLILVCADPQLGFVISPQRVGFDPMRHGHAGIWQDWNLYDCRKVRSAQPTT